MTNSRLAKAEAALAGHYAILTPLERFRLIVDAGARGDDADQVRIAAAGGRITLSIQDHIPFAQAFCEIDLPVYIALVEGAADYLAAFELASAASPTPQDDDSEEETGAECTKVVADAADTERLSPLEQFWHVVLMKGYVLKIHWEGWKLFCERRGFPPCASWEPLPGWARLQRALDLASRAAFTVEGQLWWLNHIRPAGEPEATELGLTPEIVADELEEMFRDHAVGWGAELPPRPRRKKVVDD